MQEVCTCDYCGETTEFETDFTETDEYGLLCPVCYDVIRDEDPTVMLAEFGY